MARQIPRMMIANIAHRGGAGLWPENTLGAFARALRLGAHGLEFDCHLTRDGAVVVFHDEALKPDLVRGPDGAWLAEPGPLIKETPLSALGTYDVGRVRPGSATARKHPEQQPLDGERIPTLQEVVRCARRENPSARLWIELKTEAFAPGRGAAPAALADAVLAVLHAEEALGQAVLIGFDWRALVHARRAVPDLATRFTTLPQSWFGPDPPPPAHGPPAAAALAALRAEAAAGAAWEAGFHPRQHGGLLPAIKAAGAGGWFPYFADVTADTMAQARALGLPVAAWTVDAPADMRRLAGLGVEAICTDRPDRLAAVLSGAPAGPA